jgi:hypothetical protein
MSLGRWAVELFTGLFPARPGMGAMNRTRSASLGGAAGRDFHNFQVCFREDPSSEVVAFTAAQIPGIENRLFPKCGLSRDPIFPESSRDRAQGKSPAGDLFTATCILSSHARLPSLCP